MSTSEFEPPGEVMVRRRWVKPERVEWALQADAILRETGCVLGTNVYDKRWRARNHVRKLKDILVSLELYESWELEEHTNRVPPSRGKGYQWALEYKGGPINGRR